MYANPDPHKWFGQVITTAKSSEGLKHSMIMSGGNALATGLAALSLILLSRWLEPTLFGAFTVAFSIAVVTSKLNDVGLVTAMMKYVPLMSSDDREMVFGSVWRTKIVVALSLWLGGWLITPILVALLDYDYPALLYLAFLLAPATAVYEQVVGQFQATRQIELTVVTNALQAGLKLIMVLALYATTQLKVGLATVLYLLIPLTSLVLVRNNLKTWLSKAYITTRLPQRWWYISLHAWVYFVSLSLIDNIDVVLVQALLSNEMTGVYSGISRIGLMFSMVAYSLGAVLYPRVARYQSRELMKVFVHKALRLSGVLMVFSLVLWWLAPLLLNLTIGEAYSSGLEALQWMLLSGVLTIVTTVLIAPVYGMQRGEWFFSLFGLLQVISLVGLMLLWVPQGGIVAAAHARVIVKIGLLFFTALSTYILYKAMPSKHKELHARSRG